jgi:hypothetical protein
MEEIIGLFIMEFLKVIEIIGLFIANPIYGIFF